MVAIWLGRNVSKLTRPIAPAITSLRRSDHCYGIKYTICNLFSLLFLLQECSAFAHSKFQIISNVLRVVIKKMRKNLQSWESLTHNAMLGYFLNTLFVEIIPGTSRIVAPFIPGTSRTVIPSILISSCQMNIPWCRHPWFWFMQGIAIKNVLQI